MAHKKGNTDYTELGLEELNEQIQESYEKFNKLVFNHAITPLENPNVLGELRRDLARMKTEKRKREIANR